MDIFDIIKKCDYTLLRQDARAAEYIQLCDEGIKYGVASVCIPPCHVSGVRNYVGQSIRICTVAGFPNGYNTARVKSFEAADSVSNGADEIDMVINLAMVKDACWDDILDEIKQVKSFCSDKTLKVIVETGLLTQDEKRILCEIVAVSGAEYIKTSTGFSVGGATVEDIDLFKACRTSGLKIKASGGIDSIELAEQLILHGADRIGTSKIIALSVEAGLL